MKTKISTWPNAYSVDKSQRKDIKIENFGQLYKLCSNISSTGQKTDQKLMTRRFHNTREAGSSKQKVANKGLITLDFDDVKQAPKEVHLRLRKAKINHFIVTTWSHKGLAGKNRFKVFLNDMGKNPSEISLLTYGLAQVTNKKSVTNPDELSTNIFFGGVNPKYKKKVETYYYNKGLSKDKQKQFLKKQGKIYKRKVKNEVEETEVVTDFDRWHMTEGQKWSIDKVKEALKVIKYEHIDSFTRSEVWIRIGYALKSTGDKSLFKLWDDWAAKNCSEFGVYDKAENRKVWKRKDRKTNDLCTMNTLWHLAKIFSEKKEWDTKEFKWVSSKEETDKGLRKPKMIIKELISVEEGVGVLAGAGGAGKSSFCLELALSMSCGGYLFDDQRFKCRKSSVAIFNKEDGRLKLSNMMIYLKSNKAKATAERRGYKGEEDFADRHVPDDSNVYYPQFAFSNAVFNDDREVKKKVVEGIIKAITSLKKELKARGRPPLRLAIFDPLLLFTAGDINHQSSSSNFVEAAKIINQKTGCTVIIVHHTNKSGSYSGSHAIQNLMRFLWLLKWDEKDKEIKFIVSKNNNLKANYEALTLIRDSKTGVLFDLKTEEEKEDDDENDD